MGTEGNLLNAFTVMDDGSIIIQNKVLANEYCDRDGNNCVTTLGGGSGEPLWTAASGDYYTKTEIDARLYLTGYTENDPIWSSVSNDYYTKTQIDNKNYITAADVNASLTQISTPGLITK